jgi:hypothetical protein
VPSGIGGIDYLSKIIPIESFYSSSLRQYKQRISKYRVDLFRRMCVTLIKLAFSRQHGRSEEIYIPVARACSIHFTPG